MNLTSSSRISGKFRMIILCENMTAIYFSHNESLMEVISVLSSSASFELGDSEKRLLHIHQVTDP
jgi:hypothetical protein